MCFNPVEAVNDAFDDVFRGGGSDGNSIFNEQGGTRARNAAAAKVKRETTGLIGKRKNSGSLGRFARTTSRRSRGFRKNIFTSLLGDSGFGGSVKSASKLGQTS